MASLQLADMPICPHCGCNDSHVIRWPVDGGWFNQGSARCKNERCGRRFSFRYAGTPATGPPATGSPPVEHQAPPIEHQSSPVDHQAPVVDHQTAPVDSPAVPDGYVPFLKTVCPKCGSTDTSITSTSRPRRKHKCNSCPATFKSHEGEAGEPPKVDPDAGSGGGVFVPRL